MKVKINQQNSKEVNQIILFSRHQTLSNSMIYKQIWNFTMALSFSLTWWFVSPRFGYILLKCSRMGKVIGVAMKNISRTLKPSVQYVTEALESAFKVNLQAIRISTMAISFCIISHKNNSRLHLFHCLVLKFPRQIYDYDDWLHKVI